MNPAAKSYSVTLRGLLPLVTLLLACLSAAVNAHAQDQKSTAERLYGEGQQLQYGQGTREALRQAVKKYEQALAIWQATGEFEAQRKTLGTLSNVHCALGEFQQAVDYLKQTQLVLQRAYEQYRATADGERAEAISRAEPIVLEQIGFLSYKYLHDKAQALAALEQARALYLAQKNRAGLARALTFTGQVYTELGEDLAEKRQGVGYLNQVLTMHREAQNRYDESDALANLMLAWKAQQRPLLAIFYGKQAVNTYQSIRASIKEKNLEKDTQETFKQSKTDVYRVLADLLIADGRLPEAQQVLSLLKEEEYFEFITRDSGDNSPPTKSASLTPEEIKLNEQYEKISAQLPELSRKYAALREKSSLTEEEKRSLKLLEEQLTIANTKFEKDLQRLDVEFGDTKQSVTLKNVREAQSMQEDLRDMEEGTVALYTLVGIDRYRVILVAPFFRKAYEYPIKGIDLANKVDAFRNALTNPRVDPLPLAQELYQILIGPMAKDLAGAEAKTLMWSLDGVLRYIPMAALHDGRQYLVERYRNVAFTYGTLAHLKDPPSATWRGLGLGVSKQHESFPALPAVPAELRGIIREQGQGDAGGGVLPGTIMLDEAFTTDSMETALRGRYPMVHIASHFAFTPGGDETQSFLLLGDGQHLTLAQIRNSVGVEFRGVDLLTLSSCNSAIGGRRGDGIEVDGLAEVAQRKGAKAVVASLWSVADASTQLLMQRFYLMREAQFGLSKAEALRQAQLSLLHGDRADAEQPRSHGSHGLADELDRLARERGITLGGTAEGTQVANSTRYTHPYFWAAFTMVGNWK